LSRVLSKNIIVAIVTLAVIGAAIAVLALTSGGGPTGGGGQQPPPQEVRSIVIDTGGFVGNNLIRVTLRNAGTVTTKITNITVKGTDIEGSQIQTLTLTSGQSGQADVGLGKGQAKTGANELTFTIKTDQGDFEQKLTINYTP